MSTTITDALIDSASEGRTVLKVPNQEKVTVYGQLPAAAAGKLLRYTVTLRASASGALHLKSCSMRRVHPGDLFFEQLSLLLHAKKPLVDQASYWHMVKDLDVHDSAAWDEKLLPYLNAWSKDIADLRVWMQFDEYSLLYDYYNTNAVFEASKEEAHVVADTLREGFDDVYDDGYGDPAAFIKLALCGSGQKGWVTESLPLNPSDVLQANKSGVKSCIYDAMVAAQPWFDQPSYAAEDANADVYASGFLKRVESDKGIAYYRATYHDTLLRCHEYPGLEHLPPFPTVSALCDGIEQHINSLRDKGQAEHIVLRRSGEVFDMRSSNRGRVKRTWSLYSDLQFLERDYTGTPQHIIVYVADNWTFTDLSRLIEKVKAYNPTIVLTALGNFNNRAGYNVVRELYDDFKPVETTCKVNTIDPSALQRPLKLKLHKMYSITQPVLQRSTVQWLLSGECKTSRWVFVCDEPELCEELECLLHDIHGPAHGPPASHKDGVPHAVVSMQVENGPADGVVGKLCRITDTKVHPNSAKRPRIHFVPYFNSPLTFANAQRTATFGPNASSCYKTVVPITANTKLVPRRIFSLRECVGLNGCSFIYVSTKPVADEALRCLASCAPARVVNVIKGDAVEAEPVLELRAEQGNEWNDWCI